MSETNISETEITQETEGYQADIIIVLRTTQIHHVTLGLIADQKANIILGAFLLFITVSQGLIKDQDQIPMPILALSVCFSIAAIFALLVITPRFRSRKPASGQLYNPLFFGSFSAIQQDEYLRFMESTLTSNEIARTLITKDIYQIGQILNKKYINLRYSYLSLGLGIIVSALWFAFLHLSKWYTQI